MDALSVDRAPTRDDPSQHHHRYRLSWRCRPVRDLFHSLFRMANRFARGANLVWRWLAHGCNPVWKLAKKLKNAPASTLTIRLGREHERGTWLRTDARDHDGRVFAKSGAARLGQAA
jgi:hypothetical protein